MDASITPRLVDSRIFHLYGGVIIAGGGLQNLGLDVRRSVAFYDMERDAEDLFFSDPHGSIGVGLKIVFCFL
jgi:hypothetical protein